MIYKLLASRTLWTFIGMFVFGGLNAVVPNIPPAFQLIVMTLLGILGAYFHINPSTTYNLPADGSSVHTPVDVTSQLG